MQGSVQPELIGRGAEEAAKEQEGAGRKSFLTEEEEGQEEWQGTGKGRKRGESPGLEDSLRAEDASAQLLHVLAQAAPGSPRASGGHQHRLKPILPCQVRE